ncbi:MAG: DUF4167 domain-containing protein [Pseudomonadota bacterium]
MKRGRNQRRRQGANPNRAFDSNGPDVRIRGTANQIHDKYIGLARDAASASDRVKAENYLQHAEHYFRVIRSMQPSSQEGASQSAENDGSGEQPAVGASKSERRPRSRREADQETNPNQGVGPDQGIGPDQGVGNGSSDDIAAGSDEQPIVTEPTAANDEDQNQASTVDVRHSKDSDSTDERPRQRRKRRSRSTAKSEKSEAPVSEEIAAS